MPFVMPIEVQLPPMYDASAEFLQERVSRYAQALVEEDMLVNRPYRKMLLSEVEANSISIDESERRTTDLIRRYYETNA